MSRIAIILPVLSLFLFSCSDSDNPVEPDDPIVTYTFTHLQDIATEGGADFESFDIGAETYLAVANASDGHTVNVDSKIYRWVDTSFVEIQTIPTFQASDWEYFEIGAQSYLAVANLYNGSTYQIDSKIYRWNGASFVEFQSIPTSGAFDWEFFSIGTELYLVVANQHEDSSNYNIDSKIYRWNGTSFIEFQSIPTNGALDWEFFVAGTDSFLVVANSLNGVTYNIDSKIYRWDGSSFVEFQSIATNRATDWESFEIGGSVYLAVANFSNGTTQDIDSKIYLWNGSSFTEYQSIPTNGAIDWEYFSIDSNSYIAVANYFSTGANTYNIDSRIFIWDGASFVSHQSVATHGAQAWEYFMIDGDPYLGCANLRNGPSFQIDSIILKGIEE